MVYCQWTLYCQRTLYCRGVLPCFSVQLVLRASSNDYKQRGARSFRKQFGEAVPRGQLVWCCGVDLPIVERMCAAVCPVAVGLCAMALKWCPMVATWSFSSRGIQCSQPTTQLWSAHSGYTKTYKQTHQPPPVQITDGASSALRSSIPATTPRAVKAKLNSQAQPHSHEVFPSFKHANKMPQSPGGPAPNKQRAPNHLSLGCKPAKQLVDKQQHLQDALSARSQ